MATHKKMPKKMTKDKNHKETKDFIDGGESKMESEFLRQQRQHRSGTGTYSRQYCRLWNGHE
jgi:hypothetical protein